MSIPDHALHDQNAEEFVLGGCLANYEVFALIDAILEPSDFFFKSHEHIYSAMQALARRGDDTDVPMVAQELKRMSSPGQDLFAEVGGDYRLHELEHNIKYSGGHYVEFAQVIKDYATRVELLVASDKVKALAQNKQLSMTAIQTESENAIRSAFQSAYISPPKPIGEAVKEFSEQYYLAESGESGASSRLYTAYPSIDNPALIGGFRPGNLVVIGGDSGMGKTSLAVNFSLNFARQGKVGFFMSKEMGMEEMSRRFLSVMTGIPLVKLRKYTPEDRAQMTGPFREMTTMTDYERSIYGEAIAKFQSLPINVKHMPDPSPFDVWTQARLLKQVYGQLDYIVVDQITDMRADDQDQQPTRAQELGVMAGRFKQMATPPESKTDKGIGCVVFVLSQIKPAVKHRTNKRPMKGDFQDSTAIGNQADVQMFFYRDSEYYEDTEYPDLAEVIVRKHRDGDTGTAKLQWIGETTRLHNWSDLEALKMGMKG